MQVKIPQILLADACVVHLQIIFKDNSLSVLAVDLQNDLPVDDIDNPYGKKSQEDERPFRGLSLSQ